MFEEHGIILKSRELRQNGGRMKKVTKGARIAAIVCVILLLSMYAATFAAALAAKPYSNQMFMGCLLCTVFVPIFLHILIRLFAMMSEKKDGDTTLHEVHKARRKEKKSAGQ